MSTGNQGDDKPQVTPLGHSHTNQSVYSSSLLVRVTFGHGYLITYGSQTVYTGLEDYLKVHDTIKTFFIYILF